MKLGEEWLRDWINPPVLNKKLCKQLIAFGYEVELVKGKKLFFSNTKIGQIVSKKICNVNNRFTSYKVSLSENYFVYIKYAEKKYLSQGKKVPVVFSSPLNIVDIKKSSLDQVDMTVCTFASYHFLGIEKNNYEILILSDNAMIGSNITDFFAPYRYSMKFFLPFNRTDLRSVWGLSREVAILNKLPLPNLRHSTILDQKRSFNSAIRVITKSSYIQYIFCEFHHIKMKSVLPFFMQERLRRSNALTKNIISNIVNYVFIETGYWFHVFNLDRLGPKLYIKIIKNKKSIQDSDKKNIYLPVGTIVLENSKKILSFEDMEYVNCRKINISTKNLFLGSLCVDFHFLQNRHFSMPNLSRQIEYSKYNTNPYIQKNIFEYIQKLILDICGGISSKSQFHSMQNNERPLNTLVLTIEKLNKISGIFFTKKQVISILNFCHFSFFEKKNNFFVTPPYWRTDINFTEELIGEIIRVYGCENVKLQPPEEYTYNLEYKKECISLSRIKLFLIDRGYFEIISYSFVNSQIQKLFSAPCNILKIQNPISRDMSEMRVSLWIGLLNCISYNQKRQHESIRVFETGLCFSSQKKNSIKIIQQEYLSAAISGLAGRREWYSVNRKFDFYDLKGDLESILNLCGKLKNIEFISEKFIGLCEQNSAGIYLNGQFVGCIGILDAKFYEVFDLKDSVILFEIMWKKIRDLPSLEIQHVSELPISKRDISIIVFNYVLGKDVLRICHQHTSIQNTGIYIYDVYSGPNIPRGKKSMSICFTFNSATSSLCESDINLNILQCMKALQNKLGAILRD
ncbi:phenylalanine--tRNA ligase subunit beta [Buchnera aphidicola]|uniref:phenylalanine--tRNA ligase subunit beta n=1 Tax=Buchnera aphidicola TaxID=9 RepID=UPI00094D34F6|nr:phenylalanine--tRNA ligase subunit beta [Buchnera aphidicola]